MAEAPSAWSVANLDWSDATVAWTWAAVAASEVGSMVARVWPAVTVWPVVTLTAVTRPLTANDRLAWLAGSMVPVDDTVWVIVPVVTDSV